VTAITVEMGPDRQFIATADRELCVDQAGTVVPREEALA
jgi:hypothetical protein